MVPVCDKRYHIYNKFRHFWAEIKKLWNYPLYHQASYTLHLLGFSSMMVVTISAHTTMMTTRAIIIPFQLRFCTVCPTSSWNQTNVAVNMRFGGYFLAYIYGGQLSTLLLEAIVLCEKKACQKIRFYARFTHHNISGQTHTDHKELTHILND